MQLYTSELANQKQENQKLRQRMLDMVQRQSNNRVLPV
jgi:cell shape-determining protein MreC